MSQFSRKYYKNNYKLEENNDRPLNTRLDDGIWTFWRVWGLYEYLVLGLLGIIVFLLLTHKCGVVTHQNSYQQTTALQSLYENKAEVKDLVQKSNFPKKILPNNLLPKEESINGEKLYGPLTMEEYLYFADDVNNFYPKFFDRKSRKSIASASAECMDSNCKLTPDILDNVHMAAYTEWLSDTSAKNYTFLVKDNYYYITER